MDQAIQITGGEIMLNEFYFSTLEYEPPQYQRSISYDDTSVSSGSLVTPRRSVTDLGPMKGVWKPFKILCYNHDNFDPSQAHRGEVMFDNLIHLFFDFIATPLVLREMQTNKVYYVMFGQEGLDVKFAQKPNQTDDFGNDMGAEYEVTVTLFEVDPLEDE